ncbi:MAG: hypothetical protein V4509_01925 [Patescibacteria group bacterium]
MTTFVFNPFTHKLDATGTGGGGGGDITITGNDNNPQTASAFTIVGVGNITFTWDGVKFVIDETTSSSQITWNSVSGTTQAMTAFNGYICTNSGLVTLTMPATGVPVDGLGAGDIVKVVGYGAGGIRISQPANTQITLFNGQTTAGVSGFVQTDGSQATELSLICVTGAPNYRWAQFEAGQGNMTPN